MPIKILDVGQCGFDGPRMSRLLREKLDATVDCAATEQDATRHLAAGRYNLVLVNRILAADGVSGVELIHTLIWSWLHDAADARERSHRRPGHCCDLRCDPRIWKGCLGTARDVSTHQKGRASGSPRRPKRTSARMDPRWRQRVI